MPSPPLKLRLNLASFGLLTVVSIFMVLSVNHVQKKFAITFAEKEALILLKHNLAIHSFFNKQMKPRLFALTDGVRTPDFFDPTWMSSTYAVREIYKIYDEENSHLYYYKEAAINARSPQNEADPFEREFIERLNRDHTLEKQSGVKEFGGKPYFYTLLRGESMESDCLRCHSVPQKAPGNLVRTYGPERSFNREVGEVVSAVSIRIPLEAAYRDANRFSSQLTALLLSLIAALYFLQNKLTDRLVLAPLQAFRSRAEAISNDIDNLGATIPEAATQEMNEIAAAFNKMSHRLKNVVDGLDEAVIQRTALLKESEAKYQQLFENLSSGFSLHEMLYDADGAPCDYRFLEVNPAFEKLTGLKAADIEGKTARHSLPQLEPFWLETYAAVTRSGKPITFQHFCTPLDRHYQVWAFSPGSGTFATLFNDVTETINAERVLRESEDRLRTYIAAAPHAVLVLDEMGRFLEVNPAACSMTGYTEAELHSMRISDLLPGNAHLWVSETLQQLKETGKSVGERTFRRKNGETAFWSLSAVKLSATRYLCFVVDVTYQRLAEQEKQLMEQQIQQTQKLESLGVLAGGIAHDFNNILAIILGHCALAKYDSEKLDDHLREVERATERAAELCRQMLTYAGKAQPTCELFSPTAVVNDMVKMLRTSIGKNVVIVSTVDEDTPAVMGDASQIRQIIMNLLINASEAIGEAQGRIGVTLTQKVVDPARPKKDHLGNVIAPGRYVCLQVSDNGCGMDERTRKRIFEPFYSTKFTGRGLGMSAVLGIIQAHHGALQLISEQGIGTTFRVYLPADVDLQRAVAFQNVSVGQLAGEGAVVLLVEDEEQIQEIAKAQLSMLGLQVIQAANGQEALEIYRQRAADITLVITDMGMPVMDGYTLFRELKSCDPALPIVISSGFGDVEVYSRIPAEEIAGTISKPYSLEKLRATLEQVLSRKARR